VEIEINGLATRQPSAPHLVEPGGHEPDHGSMIDARTVAGQIGAFGHHVEASKQGDTLIANQVHDVALAFRADEFERQQRPQGLFGGNHLRTGEIGLTQHFRQADVVQQRHEEEEAAEAGAERAGLQAQGPHVGRGLSSWPERCGPFVIEAAGQAGEAFLAQQDGEGIDTDGVTGQGQFALDVVDGEIAFAHRHDEFADTITNWGETWPVRDGLEEADLLIGVMAELVTEDTERTGRVAETAGDLKGRKAIDEVGAEGLVLSVQRVFWDEEEVGQWR
jgi:hypothetical protein